MTIDTFNELQYYESDEFNLARLGRRWFGDRFDFDPDKTFEFDFPRLVSTELVRLKVYAAAIGEVNTTMTLRVNNADVDTFFFDPIDDPILGDDDFFNGSLSVSSSQITVGLSFNNAGNPASLGYLDYISIEAVSSLEYIASQFQFKYNDAAVINGIGNYVLSNASEVPEVWDVSDRFNIRSISNTDANSTLSFKAPMGQVRIFQVVDPTDVYEPLRDSNNNVSELIPTGLV